MKEHMPADHRPDGTHADLVPIIDSMTNVVGCTDKTGVIIYMNPATYAFWGYTREEMVGRNIVEFLQQENASDSSRTTNEGDANNRAFYASKIIRKDGTVAEVEWHNTWDETKQLYFGIGYLVKSKYKRSPGIEELAAHVEKEYKSIPDVLERITDGFYAFDKDFVITYFNKKSEEWLGVSREEVVGRNIWEAFPAAVEGKLYRKYHEGLKHQKPEEFEFYWEKDDDWYQVSTYPSTQGMSVFYKNITEKKRLEQRLQDEISERHRVVTAAVIRAEEDVRSHIGTELHDNINQVLSVVKLYVEMCLKSRQFNEEVLAKSVSYLNDCINEIRSLSKQLSAPAVGTITLQSSIGELINELNATRSVFIRYNSAGFESVEIPQALHINIFRIVQEHLNNILKHANASEVELNIGAIDDKILLSVHDNGKGFDLMQKRNGIGITNMITRAEALKGRLAFDTAPGKGCVMRAEFPMSLMS